MLFKPLDFVRIWPLSQSRTNNQPIKLIKNDTLFCSFLILFHVSTREVMICANKMRKKRRSISIERRNRENWYLYDGEAGGRLVSGFLTGALTFYSCLNKDGVALFFLFFVPYIEKMIISWSASRWRHTCLKRSPCCKLLCSLCCNRIDRGLCCYLSCSLCSELCCSLCCYSIYRELYCSLSCCERTDGQTDRAITNRRKAGR